MILRSLRLGQGRTALPKPATPAPVRSCRRYASTLERRERPEFTQSAPTERLIASSGPKKVIEVNDPNHPVAQDYLFYQHQKERTGDLGAQLTPTYKPRDLVANPPRPRDVTLEALMASQAHLGHATALWHPGNAGYIFGVRGEHDPIHIISLDVTAAHLRRACKIVSGVTERGGLVLFVGTRAQQSSAVVRAAQLAKGCHLFKKWTPGTITNGQQILGGCARKVVNEFDEEVPGFEDQLSAKAVIKPDLVVCLNPLENYTLLHECGINNIPTIGIIDTDVNPTWVTYPIPANDDSLRCVQYIVGVLGRAGQEGQQKRLEMAREGVITYTQAHGLDPPKRTSGRSKKSASAAAADDVYDEALFTIDADSNVPEDPESLQDDWTQINADRSLQNTLSAEEAPLADETSADSADDAIRELDAQFPIDEPLPPSLQHEHDASPPNATQDEGQSTWDQVESVEKELGEQVKEADSTPRGTAERGLDEEPGMMPDVPSPAEGAGRQDFGTPDDVEPKLEDMKREGEKKP